MVSEMKECSRVGPLLIKRFSSDLSPDEVDYLESHLAACASCAREQEKLSNIWRSFDSFPDPQIPPRLEQKTREMIRGYLRCEKALLPLISKVSGCGRWAFSIPLVAGLLMTGVSYSLVRNIIGSSFHHHYIFFSVYGLWWLLFTVSFWLLFRTSDHSVSQLSLVSAQSILVTFLALFFAFLAFEIEPFSQHRIYAASKLAAASQELLGVGSIIVASWWILCCLAAFIGGLTFGTGRLPLEQGNLFVAGLIATVLVTPAIFLHGSSHGHEYAMIAFAVVGTYAGALVGMASGLIVGRQLSFQAAHV